VNQSQVADTTFNDLSKSELAALLLVERAEHKAEIQSHRLLIEQMKLTILKLRQMQFGQRSEKRAQEIEQLELGIEQLEAVDALAHSSGEQNDLFTGLEQTQSALKKNAQGSPRRRELPAHLPREVHIIEPKETRCPDCGNELRTLGEDVSEMLELEPIRFKVIRYVRPKHACKNCDTIVQAPAPNRPIDRGIAGPGLLAHVLVSKFSDHLPLYRQSEIYARDGVDLDRSLLAQWVGRASGMLAPLIDALKNHVFSADVVHSDDTPIPVLSPGLGKTKIGRLWTYVRDERPAGGKIAPAVWFAYSANRKGEHPKNHLRDFTGVLQADGYSGYTQIYEGGKIFEAACWAHARRKFIDLHKANQSSIAAEALDRIGELYAIEQEIRGKLPNLRREIRQARSRPLLENLHCWLEATLQTLSQKSATALAIKYSLTRWEALTRYCTDGRIEIDNNAAERSLRCVALGRKNFLFAGSDRGGDYAAGLYSLIGTAKLNGCDPEAFLREVFKRINDQPILSVGDLLPWNLPALTNLQTVQESLPA
jgi:transposase